MRADIPTDRMSNIAEELKLEGKSLLEQVEDSQKWGECMCYINFENRASPYQRSLGRDVAYILDKNLRLVKKLSGILIQSIFDHVYSMPIGLRILCKIMYLLAQKKVLFLLNEGRSH